MSVLPRCKEITQSRTEVMKKDPHKDRWWLDIQTRPLRRDAKRTLYKMLIEGEDNIESKEKSYYFNW